MNLYYNEVSSEIAMNRAFARFVQNGRFLPLDYVAGIYKDPKRNPTVTYYELLKEGVADYYEHESNAVPYGTEPPLVESPTGRDLYISGNRGKIQPERPIRQGGNSDSGNLAGDVQSEKINQRADAESSGFFNAQNSENAANSACDKEKGLKKWKRKLSLRKKDGLKYPCRHCPWARIGALS